MKKVSNRALSQPLARSGANFLSHEMDSVWSNEYLRLELQILDGALPPLELSPLGKPFRGFPKPFRSFRFEGAHREPVRVAERNGWWGVPRHQSRPVCTRQIGASLCWVLLRHQVQLNA
jgi:hypothetical protein